MFTHHISKMNVPDQPDQPDQVVVCTLDINWKNEGGEEFYSLSPKAQVDVVVKNIKLFIEKAKQEFPDDMWLIVLRENAILALGSSYPFTIDVEEKDYLIQEIVELLIKNKNLNVIAGSVAVKRPVMQVAAQLVGDLDKSLTKREVVLKILAQQRDYYFQGINQELWDIEDEQHKKEDDSPCIRTEYEKIQRVEEEIKKCTTDEEAEKIISQVYIISNSAYVFHHVEYVSQFPGPVMLTRVNVDVHRKSAPYEDSGSNPYYLFRPSSEKTSNNHFEFLHPKSRKKIPIRLLICRESFIFNYNVEEKAKPLEILISNTTEIFNKQLKEKKCDHLIHVDSVYHSRLIKMHDSSIRVKLFTIDILNKKPVVRGPLKPYVPIQLTLINQMEKALKEYKEAAEWIDEEYSKFKQEVKDGKSIDYANIKINLSKKIGKNKVFDAFVSYMKESQVFFSFYHQFFQNEYDKLVKLHHDFYHAIPPDKELGEKSQLRQFYETLSEICEGENIYLQVVAKVLMHHISGHLKNPYRQALNAIKESPLEADVKPATEMKMTRAR